MHEKIPLCMTTNSHTHGCAKHADKEIFEPTTSRFSLQNRRVERCFVNVTETGGLLQWVRTGIVSQSVCVSIEVERGNILAAQFMVAKLMAIGRITSKMFRPRRYKMLNNISEKIQDQRVVCASFCRSEPKHQFNNMISF